MAEAWKRWEGRTVGAFQLSDFLGSSPTSAVFLTQLDGDMPQLAAIKLMPENAPHAQEHVAGWQAASTLFHQNLIRIFQTGHGEIDGHNCVYVVMEYAEENLGQVVPNRALTEEEVSMLLVPTLNALEFLHANGLVHGRVKPSDVMAIGDRLKVSTDGVRRPGEAMETGEYDPPEGTSSVAGDVWSLGVTLVEILTQTKPVWDRKGSGDPIVPDGLPGPLMDVARNCLRRDPKRRWTIAGIRKRLMGPLSGPLDGFLAPSETPAVAAGAGAAGVGAGVGTAAAGAGAARASVGASPTSGSAAGVARAVEAAVPGPVRAAVSGAQAVSSAAASGAGATGGAVAEVTLPERVDVGARGEVAGVSVSSAAAGAGANGGSGVGASRANVGSGGMGAGAATGGPSSGGASAAAQSAPMRDIVADLRAASADSTAAGLRATLTDPGLGASADADEEHSRRGYLALAVVVFLAVVALLGFKLMHPTPKAASETATTAPQDTTTEGAAQNAPGANGAEQRGQSPTNQSPTNQSAVPAQSAVPSQPAGNAGGASASNANAASGANSSVNGAANGSRSGVVHQVVPEASQKSLETITGAVRVGIRVTAGASGDVTDAEIDSEGPSTYFANLSLAAAKQWKFAGAGEWKLRFEFRNDGAKVFAEKSGG